MGVKRYPATFSKKKLLDSIVGKLLRAILLAVQQ